MTNKEILQAAGIGVFIHGAFGQTLLTVILNAMTKAREDERAQMTSDIQLDEFHCACKFIRREEFAESEQIEWCGLHSIQRDEIERLRNGHERYETARRMNVRAWSDAWTLNIVSGKPFDEIIDDLRPFLLSEE